MLDIVRYVRHTYSNIYDISEASFAPVFRKSVAVLYISFKCLYFRHC
jgi:hypothetical protein